jgi:RNA polymerase sigma factor (sigma-70 family)
MDKKDFWKRVEIKDHETSLTELDPSYSTGNDFDFHQNKNLCNWIDDIQNEALHKVLQNLSEEEKILLSYVFYKDKTQTEIARIYHVSQPRINQRISKLIEKIKLFLFKK